MTRRVVEFTKKVKIFIILTKLDVLEMKKAEPNQVRPAMNQNGSWPVCLLQNKVIKFY